MANPLATLKGYDDNVLNAFMIDGVNKNIEVFNEKSRGTIILDTFSMKNKEFSRVFSKYLGDAMSDRDIGTDAVTTFTNFEQIDTNRVKKAVKFPITIPASSLQWTTGMDADKAVDMVMDALIQAYTQSLVDFELKSIVSAFLGACKSGTTDTFLDNSLTEELTTSSLQRTLELMGDAQGRVKGFLMHSSTWGKLKINALDNANDGLQNMQAWQGMFNEALGRVVIISDQVDLIDTDVMSVLGLTEGAGYVGVSASNTSIVEDNSIENNATKFKTDTDYSLEVKGCKFDVVAAGSNPTDTQLATAANWDINVNHKYAMGVLGSFKATAV